MKRVAIFASGSGTNAENLICNLHYGQVCLLICNNPKAYVLERAKKLNVPCILLSKAELHQLPQPGEPHVLLQLLHEYQIDVLLLAGYLLQIPPYLIERYPKRIINIHPALLPKYGGKGMYGHHVHQAVIDAKEKESGITIHLVDDLYDHGKPLFQAHCTVTEEDTPETLAQKIHWLEQEHFPQVVDKYLQTIY